MANLFDGPTMYGDNHNPEELDSTSLSASYCQEWEKLMERNFMKENLKLYAIHGKLRSCRFRSVCWRVFLNVLPENTEEWVDKTNQMRAQYDQLKEKLITNPHVCSENSDPSIDNPLSQEMQSPWNQFFQDNELRITIRQDVIRTYPRIEFFHTDYVRGMLVDALFIFAKINPDISYRQGMHELLAPLIFVLHCDHQAFLHACEIESVKEIVRVLLNPEYIEHDAFAIFCQIMATAEPWYVSKEYSPTLPRNQIIPCQPFARSEAPANPSNVIVTKLSWIQDCLLRKHDAELHHHLEQLDIPPQVYGIRWVRLLFGREFPMQDLLVLWDAIFSDGISFDLVDYVFIAMLMYLRDTLLAGDYPSCLTTLMKYPAVGDIGHFIQMALHLRQPSIPRPVSLVPKAPSSKFKGSKDVARIAEKAASVMSGLTRKLQHNTRQMSVPGTLIDDRRVPLPRLSGDVPGPQHGWSGLGPLTRMEESTQEQELMSLTRRLNETQGMCRKCADKMDVHVDKLQTILLDNDIDQADEMLLSLAGLKQVRDVLKGILKPSNLFDEAQLEYTPVLHDLSPSSSSSAATNHLSPPEEASEGSNAMLGNADLSTSASTSPEYSEDVPCDMRVHIPASKAGKGGKKPDIELQEIHRPTPGQVNVTSEINENNFHAN